MAVDVRQPPVPAWQRGKVASWLVAAWNQNVALRVMSPAGAAFEEAALRWTAVDLESGTLTVHEQIVVVDGQDVVGFPKSASSRRIAISSGLSLTRAVRSASALP